MQPVQVGDHNSQEIHSAVESFVAQIENSAATPGEKAEAKGLLRRRLENPAVAAAAGGALAGLLKGGAGG